ncbi:hypothetical protein [Solemya elarraichensis gill symbiont]|uniref:Uncharacterized protein n=1 Tax=Solemya elarraichensis gill symbiont TaxID=1918949 RepID=A0A1T2L446_9GAMM|nr:hypothetical protein [Solemya elarraichensis gill symbiont]OOZ39863.1 hypothetical protein BOW52_06685 [Solemya elarraichensis gill symbiont]
MSYPLKIVAFILYHLLYLGIIMLSARFFFPDYTYILMTCVLLPASMLGGSIYLIKRNISSKQQVVMKILSVLYFSGFALMIAYLIVTSWAFV